MTNAATTDPPVGFTHTIPVSERASVTALQTLAAKGSSGNVVVYAPGAGSNIHDPFGSHLSAFLASRGIESWRFQFPYAEQGRKAPDRPAVLEATWQAVLAHVREQTRERRLAPRLIASGRSMGGRIASVVVTKGEDVSGLALFAYPLIPAGRTTDDRSTHFAGIDVPVLMCSGTRDTFGTPEQLRRAASKLPNATMHFLDGVDHGFNVAKASGRTREDVWQEVCGALLEFMDRLP